jgi:hypothetical protein
MRPNSKGVLIYAFNSNFDYVRSAKFAAKQVKKFLNLPVTLVTDENIDGFDSIIKIDKGKCSIRSYRTSDGKTESLEWFNQNRTSAFELSPYDQTLLIDADYFMFNDSLKVMFDTNSEFACFKEINDVSNIVSEKSRLSQISIPMQWATVIYFTKCNFSKSVFEFIEIIKNNCNYYSLLYGFNNATYRNDFALSIALQALSGYSTNNYNQLPGKLHTILSFIDIIEVKENNIVYFWNNELSRIINTNVHCINKKALEKFYA